MRISLLPNNKPLERRAIKKKSTGRHSSCLPVDFLNGADIGRCSISMSFFSHTVDIGQTLEQPLDVVGTGFESQEA